MGDIAVCVICLRSKNAMQRVEFVVKGEKMVSWLRFVLDTPLPRLSACTIWHDHCGRRMQHDKRGQDGRSGVAQ